MYDAFPRVQQRAACTPAPAMQSHVCYAACVATCWGRTTQNPHAAYVASFVVPCHPACKPAPPSSARRTAPQQIPRAAKSLRQLPKQRHLQRTHAPGSTRSLTRLCAAVVTRRAQDAACMGATGHHRTRGVRGASSASAAFFGTNCLPGGACCATATHAPVRCGCSCIIWRAVPGGCVDVAAGCV